MAVVGCDIPVRNVVGADQLSSARAGLWTKTHFWQEGNYLHARTFLVTAGEPSVLEFRIDLRPLEKVAARIHQRLHEKLAAKTGGPVVGFSFSKAFKSIKSTAKKIGKSKLVKAVGSAVKTVVKSKFVGSLAAGLAVVVPAIGVPALAAYAAANAALKAVDKGKQLVHTATRASHTISSAAKMTAQLGAAKAQAPAAVQSAAAAAQARAAESARAIAVQAKARAAAQPTAAATSAVNAAAAAKAKAALAAGQAQAKAVAQKASAELQSAAARVAPVARAAATLRAKLADPVVRAKLTAIKQQADSAKQVLSEIKEKAATGTGAEKLDAQKSAAIVNLVAKNQARIQAMSQLNAGGLPSLLIDGKGRIVPGKFRVVTASGGKNPDVLYRGPKSATQKGAFAKVSGEGGLGARVSGLGEEVGAASGAYAHWWTIEIKPVKSPRWISLQPNGILFREHWQAGKAAQWHEQRGIPARAMRVKYTPTPGELEKSRNRIGASPFPPLSPREKQAKDAAYVEWLKKHAPRNPRIGWTQSPAWTTTVAGDDDAEIGARWDRLPQTGRGLYVGDKVKFFVDGKSLNGRIQKNSHKAGHLVIKATPKSGGQIHTAVPQNNVYAVDLHARWRRDPTAQVGWSQPPAWASQQVGWSAPPAWTSPPGSIGCACSDQGTEF